METIQRVVILPHEKLGTIHPHLHGHFAEHLGELVYNGLWVGPDSPIPNTDGIRNDVIDALRPLGIPLLRWPGGNFADTYRWRDGIGPRDRRPFRLNTQWGNAPEPNHFGTHEFIAFCRALGAEPYFAANLGSETPANLRDWVEYCNQDRDSALAQERAANGSDEPFGVAHWGVGNEAWGAGGNMGPEHYAAEFCRYRTYLHEYSRVRPYAIAAGANDRDWDWTRRFFEYLTKNHHPKLRLIDAYAVHYYAWNVPFAGPTYGTATRYDLKGWVALMLKALAIEGVIRGHRAVMDEFDPERKVALIVDEWGAWHAPEPGKPHWGLYQQNALRDALVAAITLDVFHNHAGLIRMACLAQLVNVLQSLLLVQDDRLVKTPTYHVFDLYRPHQAGEAVRFISAAEELSRGDEAPEARQFYPNRSELSLRVVHGSASLRNGRLCVTAANTHPTQPIELEVQLARATLDEVQVVELAGETLTAHNTFDHPDAVRLLPPRTVRAKGSVIRVPMRAASVLRLRGRVNLQ